MQKENRTNQNFGWSLQIGSGNSPSSSVVPLVACAPMWRFRHGNVSEMTGACFLSRVDRGSDSILVDGPNTTPFYPCLYRKSKFFFSISICFLYFNLTLLFFCLNFILFHFIFSFHSNFQIQVIAKIAKVRGRLLVRAMKIQQESIALVLTVSLRL